MTVRMKGGFIESITKVKDLDLKEEGYASMNASGMYMCPGLIDCKPSTIIVKKMAAFDRDLRSYAHHRHTWTYCESPVLCKVE